MRLPSFGESASHKGSFAGKGFAFPRRRFSGDLVPSPSGQGGRALACSLPRARRCRPLGHPHPFFGREAALPGRSNPPGFFVLGPMLREGGGLGLYRDIKARGISARRILRTGGEAGKALWLCRLQTPGPERRTSSPQAVKGCLTETQLHCRSSLAAAGHTSLAVKRISLVVRQISLQSEPRCEAIPLAVSRTPLPQAASL